MSDCQVCIGSDEWESPEFYNWEFPKARKEYKCGECRRTITKGQQYERYTAKFDGEMQSEKTCMDCSHIRKAFTCEGSASPPFGDLWHEIQGNFPHLTSTACLTKIKTPSAKEYFLDRWRAWKFKTTESNVESTEGK
jgi:hypothetical protein